MANTLLEMRGITKTFPGVKALSDVHMAVEDREIHALCGENGAGKSTLMNVLSGIYPYGSYEGTVLFDNELCQFHSIKDSEKRGIVIIHQELALVPYLTIAENMFLGNERQTHGRMDWNATYQQAHEHLAVVGLNEDSRTLVKDIGTGKQQLLEIAKALAKNVRLLILDEPTSSLNESDARKLLDLLLQFKREKGITSILISHKLNELAYVADKITVLRDGQAIETLEAGDVTEERIIRGMVGREIVDRFPKRTGQFIGEVALEVKGWTVYHPQYTERKVVDNVDILLRRGEVVGIAGLIGAGRTELAMSVFGKAYGAKISGTLVKDGHELRVGSIPEAIANGLAYITEDRKGNGLVLSNSVKHNVTLAHPAAISRRGVLDKDLEALSVEEYRTKLDIRCPTIEQQVGNLSGGNQQKVLVGKWMFAEPEIMLLDEPTRGVDVGAKYEIYQIINALVAQGKSILLISSELPELLGMCDRIYVMYDGRMVAELPREEASQEIIMNHIMQASKGET
ncbi:MAG: ATP-binding cassette domain-containing protein [Clostridia bacterium]|nr:ATP-binding cassette domain-containing protein [Clostridia bacterium]